MATLSSIDLRIADRLKEPGFRREWYRAILENKVPVQFRDLREARNMTQSDLATATGMKQSAISRFESQRVANWKLETLLKMADALDAQLEILLIPSEQVIAHHEAEEVAAVQHSNSVTELPSRTGRFNDVGGLTSKFNAVFDSGRKALQLPTTDVIAAKDLARRRSDRPWN